MFYYTVFYEKYGFSKDLSESWSVQHFIFLHLKEFEMMVPKLQACLGFCGHMVVNVLCL